MKAFEALSHMRQLPFAQLADLVGGGRPLILAPHQDDECLGCGGLIAESAVHGLRPVVLFLTDGSGSHPRSRAFPASRLRAVREHEALTALAFLGVCGDDVGFLRQGDAEAPHDGPAFELVVQTISAWALRRRCTSIFAPWNQDPHCDHLAAHKAATAAASSSRLQLFSYPVWGWLIDPDQTVEGEIRGYRLDIGGSLVLKRHAIDLYNSQLGRLVFDSPTPFVIPSALIDACTMPFEVFLVP